MERKKGRRLMLILVAVALAVHIIYVTTTSHEAVFQVPIIDAAAYHNQAIDIVSAIPLPAHSGNHPYTHTGWHCCTHLSRPAF